MLKKVVYFRKFIKFIVVLDNAISLLLEIDNNICEQFNSIINKHLAKKRINFSQKYAYSGIAPPKIYREVKAEWERTKQNNNKSHSMFGINPPQHD